MNELEKQIEAQKVEPTCWRDQGYNSGFHCGANFILEKNLEEQFADFLHLLSAIPANEKGKWDVVDKDFNMYTMTTKELKSYWLNNVYGK